MKVSAAEIPEDLREYILARFGDVVVLVHGMTANGYTVMLVADKP